MHSDNAEARKIYQDLIDRSADALLGRDFKRLKTFYTLPHEIESAKGSRTFTTSEELLEMFAQIHTDFERMGVTGMIRRCIAADFLTPDSLQGTHKTRMLAGASPIHDAYPVYSVVRREGGIWKFAYSVYALNDAGEEVLKIRDALLTRPRTPSET
jgi:hypothetical protein